MFEPLKKSNKKFVKQYLMGCPKLDVHAIWKVYERKLRGAINPTVKSHLEALSRLPVPPENAKYVFNSPSVKIGKKGDLSDLDMEELVQIMKTLSPWRKGPFSLYGLELDAEWQSNLKWARIEKELPDLKGKRVVDLGCNSGYYMYRMAAHEPEFVMGVDPSMLFYMQFTALNLYFAQENLAYFPIKQEDLACSVENSFDVIFSMGILYHQLSPLESIKQLRQMINKNGTVVLETIVWPGKESMAYVPESTYAKMPNVYFLPTVKAIENWARIAKFGDVKVISTSKTSTKEQRQTQWSTGHSLAQFLDPNDKKLTVEGYPAPERVVMVLRP